ncbi:putative rhoptry kinase family protein ROP34 [Toxoplasma gondii p89]|uniref:Putative rhoptry kinase family protein ROP34 n=2 Tax=Toxoplasma gondii TaxID=5811 RepID=A0A2T6IP58_TOXGO|nr:putative rhoptry kinase family protein ROP34 [Toxoplasma gondii p89]PUA87126.1 putative rhoptry kinase family protein ROP34 [Toxoplasma gondii TgCATBr9]
MMFPAVAAPPRRLPGERLQRSQNPVETSWLSFRILATRGPCVTSTFLFLTVAFLGLSWVSVAVAAHAEHPEDSATNFLFSFAENSLANREPPEDSAARPSSRSGGAERRRLDSLIPGFLKRRRIFKQLRPVDEFQLREFQEASSKVKAQFFSAGHSKVTFVDRPSAALLSFLHLEEEDVPYGVVIKAIPYDAFDFYESVAEPYIHRMFDDPRKFPYVVPVLAALRSTSKRVLYLVLPLYRELPETVDEEARSLDFVLLLAEMAMAVCQLHERNLAHRDLKEDNFLVSPEGHIVVSDLATLDITDNKSFLIGTSGYMPPETRSSYLLRKGYKRSRYGEKTDVYSLGVAFQHLAFMLEGLGVQVPHRTQLAKLIKKMTSPDPEKRPLIGEVMEDPFFASVDFRLVRQRAGKHPFKKLPGADLLAERQRARLEAREKADAAAKAADNAEVPAAKSPAGKTGGAGTLSGDRDRAGSGEKPAERAEEEKGRGRGAQTHEGNHDRTDDAGREELREGPGDQKPSGEENRGGGQPPGQREEQREGTGLEEGFNKEDAQES